MTFDQNDRKDTSSTSFYFEQLIGKIGCFEPSLVLIVQLNIFGGVNLDLRNNFQDFDLRVHDTKQFYFPQQWIGAKIRTPIDTTRNIANDRKCNHQFSKQSAPSCKECTSTIVTELFPKIGRAIGRNLLPFLMAKKTSLRPDSRIRNGIGEVLITIFFLTFSFPEIPEI